MGIFLAILGIVVTIIFAIYYGRKAITRKTFKTDFSKIVKKVVREEIEAYLNGLPFIKDKDKQNILKQAFKNMENYKYDSAISSFKDYLNSFTISESERCAILNFIGISQSEIGENLEAKNTFNEMILIAKRINDYEALAVANGNMGVILVY
ncbi:unnamed protein product [marine sediment metagenome]|uniref:Uncharacterized protein n=1 Tax=marine sediment metagenome TaxID=412755 RepID=X1MB26_9ZZZZ